MDALLLVDIQNDFLPGGALAVPEGDAVIPVIHTLYPFFSQIIASKDWHPKEHKSFASVHGKNVGEVIDLNGIPQILWPDHCIQETFGSQFSAALDTQPIKKIFFKGVDCEIDSYSAFFDNGKQHDTGLFAYLTKLGVKTLYIAGLATDYCVKYSVLDAVSLGFKTYVIKDGCRAVNLNPEDESKALDEMKQAGAEIIYSSEIIASRDRIS